MTATTSQINRLRRMTAEPTEETYTTEDLATVIESHPMVDQYGRQPDHVSWEATYDLNRAAAEIWEEKASSLTGQYDFSADGGSYSRSQSYEQANREYKKYWQRRQPKPTRQRREEIDDHDDYQTT